jgi:cell division protein FtsA
VFGISKKQKSGQIDEKTYVAIDIGTENIKTVLFRTKNKQVEVLGYGITPQKSNAMNKALIIDQEEVTSAVDKSIGQALAQAEEKFDEVPLPQSAVVGIAGELVSGVPIVVSVERDNPSEEITEYEVDEVVQKVKEHTFSSIRDEIADENGIPASQLEEIETELDATYVDGVKVKNPIGLSGTEITYRVFSSFAPKIQVESINNIVRALALDLEKIVVEPYALAESLGDISRSSEGAIIIDVGSGTTDIAVIKNGDIQGIKMFAIGGRAFTRRIQSALDISYEEAEAKKIEYSASGLDEYVKKEIKKSLKPDIDTWLTGLELALAEFDEVDTFPDKIYICGGGALLPEIMEGIMEHPWIQRLKFQKHPKVRFVFPNKVEDVNDLTRSLNNPIDVTPLALTRSIFINK